MNHTYTVFALATGIIAENDPLTERIIDAAG